MLTAKVKICGITNYRDARAAMDMGADLLGFNFYDKSPRFVQPEKATEIINKLPAFIDIAGVFVNSSYDFIHNTVVLCTLDFVQLHGDEDAQFCRSLLSLDVKTIKAVRVLDHNDIKKTEDFPVDAILLDAFSSEKYGGTGLGFDWGMIGHISKDVFIAGGITPDNAGEAVKLGFYGIDVCSGIESEPGKKDHKKMKKLFDNIRHLRGL